MNTRRSSPLRSVSAASSGVVKLSIPSLSMTSSSKGAKAKPGSFQSSNLQYLIPEENLNVIRGNHTKEAEPDPSDNEIEDEALLMVPVVPLSDTENTIDDTQGEDLLLMDEMKVEVEVEVDTEVTHNSPREEDKEGSESPPRPRRKKSKPTKDPDFVYYEEQVEVKIEEDSEDNDGPAQMDVWPEEEELMVVGENEKDEEDEPQPSSSKKRGRGRPPRKVKASPKKASNFKDSNSYNLIPLSINLERLSEEVLRNYGCRLKSPPTKATSPKPGTSRSAATSRRSEQLSIGLSLGNSGVRSSRSSEQEKRVDASSSPEVTSTSTRSRKPGTAKVSTSGTSQNKSKPGPAATSTSGTSLTKSMSKPGPSSSKARVVSFSSAEFPSPAKSGHSSSDTKSTAPSVPPNNYLYSNSVTVDFDTEAFERENDIGDVPEIEFPEFDSDDIYDPMVFEVCVDNFESILNAKRGGAQRIELCSALSEGGLTPTPGLLKMAKANLRIPVFVMIRPRGGDFIYTNSEIEIMAMDILTYKEMGADGFVFGALDTEGQVDEKKCNMLMKAADPLPVTFHRAFDLVPDPAKALEIIVKLGFSRVLTSGQQATAEKGISFIRKLVIATEGHLTILAGTGVNANNVSRILRETGVREVHGSARVKIKSKMKATGNNGVVMGAPGTDDTSIYVTDASMVQRIVKCIEEFKAA